MIYQNREIYTIESDKSASTTDNLIFDDFDIIYLTEPYNEKTYEEDELLNFIDENNDIIKKSVYNYETLYKKKLV